MPFQKKKTNYKRIDDCRFRPLRPRPWDVGRPDVSWTVAVVEYLFTRVSFSEWYICSNYLRVSNRIHGHV